jgi:phosphopantothenoylcysteine decarboxylase/phosphopantothenate--cysteine ligase
MNEKHILLIISGGIAAVKLPDLIRKLTAQGARVTPVLTQSSAQFVTPLSIAALARSKVYTELFDLTEEAQMGHIELSRAADLVLVAPATAQIMAKMAQGMADDLASTLLLATDTPVMIAPSMNVRMWQHPATQRNLKQLQEDGVQVIGPNDGEMACGEYGPGRMAEADEILAQVAGFFSQRTAFRPSCAGDLRPHP